MILWSIQPASVWTEIEDKGVYHTDETNDEFAIGQLDTIINAYDWLQKQILYTHRHSR